MVRNEGGASTTRRQTSSSSSAAWEIFTKNDRPTGGGALTATCRECGQTLRAGSSIGTSHLLRHISTKRCQELAARRRRRRQQLTATAPSFTADEASPPPPSGDHSTSPAALVSVEEEEFFVVDDIDVPELMDHLVDEDLVNIIDEEPSRVDEHLFSANCYVPAVPQAASSSIKWFRQKRQRKWAESNKGKDESTMDLSLSAEAEFSSREKKMLLANSAAATVTIQDHSNQASNESRAAALYVYKLG